MIQLDVHGLNDHGHAGAVGILKDAIVFKTLEDDSIKQVGAVGLFKN